MNFSNTALLSSVEVVKGAEVEVMELFENSTTRAIDVTASNFEVEVNGNSTITVNTEKGSLDFVIKSKIFGAGKESQTMLFRPSIEFKSIGDFNVFEYYCENKTDKDTEMKMCLVAVDGSTFTSDVGLPANTSRIISCPNRLNGKQIMSVLIEFENVRTEGNLLIPLGDRTISISNVKVR